MKKAVIMKHCKNILAIISFSEMIGNSDNVLFLKKRMIFDYLELNNLEGWEVYSSKPKAFNMKEYPKENGVKVIYADFDISIKRLKQPKTSCLIRVCFYFDNK